MNIGFILKLISFIFCLPFVLSSNAFSAELQRELTIDLGTHTVIEDGNEKTVAIRGHGASGATYKLIQNGIHLGYVLFNPKGYGQDYVIINLTSNSFFMQMECDSGRGSIDKVNYQLRSNQLSRGSIGTSGSGFCDPDRVNIKLRWTGPLEPIRPKQIPSYGNARECYGGSFDNCTNYCVSRCDFNRDGNIEDNYIRGRKPDPSEMDCYSDCADTDTGCQVCLNN